MKLGRTAVVGALVGILGGMVALAAPASAYSPITVYSPNGTTVRDGASVKVTGHNGSGDTESVYVECNSSDDYSYDEYDVPPGAFSVSIGSFDGPASCDIVDMWSYDVVATFKVGPPQTTVSAASVSSDVFYPSVRDGFKDAVRFSWRQNHDGRATIRIVNSNGRTVRTATPYVWQGGNSWTWNGKSTSGRAVVEGRYRAKISVNANTVSVPVVVKSAVVTKSFAIRKEGNQGAAFATRGSCYASRDSYNQIATLDCWGGQFAKSTYRISIPAGARNVRGTIDLNHTDLDRCCQGRFTKGWSHPTARTVVLWARVSGWRATDVNFVRVAYKAKVRI